MRLIYLELACTTQGVLIFLTTHRNSHGCLKSADGDAMLIVLEVPARLYPSNEPIARRFSGGCVPVSKCVHITSGCKFTSWDFFLFSKRSFVL